MTSTRLTIGAAALTLLSAASAWADPAYVPSTVNLRTAAGTTNEIVAKIPGGSLVDASNCTDWCEVERKRRFAIAPRQPCAVSSQRPAASRAATGTIAAAGTAPVIVGGPPVNVARRSYHPQVIQHITAITARGTGLFGAGAAGVSHRGDPGIEGP